jgi:tRNA 2-selenouridine synthase
MTGSGKTRVLKELKTRGQQVIDLEELADHQGSTYGSMGKELQPSQEYFENSLAIELDAVDNTSAVWLEDESLTIGKRFIPNGIWHQMRQAPVIKMVVPLPERVKFLTEEYGRLDPEFLIKSTQRIGKRLGPEQTRDAIFAIQENRMSDFVQQVLAYYDKTYAGGQSKRLPASIHAIDCVDTDPVSNAALILSYYNSLQLSPA